MTEVRPGRWLTQVVTCSLAICSMGCRDVLGPEKMRVATVLGSVTQGGKPLTRGWIEFVPVDGTVGRMRSARLQKDGTFHATKVPVGLNLIRLVNVDIEQTKIRHAFREYASPIRRTIAENPRQRLEIDVIAEYFKLKDAPPRRENGQPLDSRRAQ